MLGLVLFLVGIIMVVVPSLIAYMGGDGTLGCAMLGVIIIGFVIGIYGVYLLAGLFVTFA